MFEPEDDMTLDAYWWVGDSAVDGPAVLESLSESDRLRVETSDAENYWDEPLEEDDSPPKRVTISLPAGQFNAESLFRMLANSAFSGDAYLVNRSKSLVFRAYDDGGVLVYAPTTDELRPLYESFNSWLVEYWRPFIDSQFDENVAE